MGAKLNRYLWMLIFFLGIAVSIWLEWLAKTTSPMAWFLVTGIWSAVCGIGFTVTNIFLDTAISRHSDRKNRG